MVEVTQEDREAAAELTGYEAIAYGMSDLSDAVQTLAHHRIAARKQALEEIEGAATDLRGPEAWLDRWAQHVGNCSGGDACTCGLTRAQFDIATAIRKLAGEG